MAIGDIITATRYNAIQTIVEDILGVGSGTEGYGMTTASNQVAVNDLVTASDMNNLYNDFDKIYRHQVNLAPSASISTISISNLIADDNSEPSSVLKGYADFENFATTISADPARFRLHSTQSTTTNLVTSNLSPSPWRNTGSFGDVGFEFGSANARRHFFNAGGKIQWNISLTSTATGGNVSKTNNWVTMFSNAGTVSLNYNSTSSDNSGTGTSIGNFQLTSGYQTVYTKTGSGLYSGNSFVIQAREASTSKIEMRVRMTDSDSGSSPSGPNNAKGWRAVDEYVQGTFTIEIDTVRATGSYVSVAQPTQPNTLSSVFT